MVDFNYYIPPRLREPLRQARGLGYSLIDNVIGIDDGYESGGERLGTAIRQDPMGVARSVGGSLLESVGDTISDPLGAIQGVAQGIGQSYTRASQGAAAYLPEGVELKDATMEQIRTANDAYLADVTNLASVVPATKAVGTAGRTAMRVGRMANDAIGADAIGLARAVAQGDLEGVGEVFQRSGQGGSVGAAKVGSDYFNPPRADAGRAKDLALFSPFSLNTKQKTAPYNWRTGANDLGILSATSLIRPEDDLGKTYYFAAGDRTSGGTEITSIGDMVLRRPVRMEAGPEFMNTGDVWASHRGVMVPKHNVLKDAQNYQDIKFAYAPMGERSGDFAKHQAELFAEAIYSSEMPRDTVARIDSELQTIIGNQQKTQLAKINKARVKAGQPPIEAPDQGVIPSVVSPAFRDWFSSQAAESVRKPFIQRIDKADIKGLEGAIDVGEVRFAATNPDLVNAPSFSAGYRFGTPDIAQGLLPSDHPSYDTKYTAKAGTGAETYGVSVPASIMARNTVLPKLAESAKSGGFTTGQNSLDFRDYLLPSEQRIFTMNPKTSQLVDNQLVDEASTYIDTYNRLGPDFANMYNRSLIEAFIRGN
jgi:hypothetical protein